MLLLVSSGVEPFAVGLGEVVVAYDQRVGREVAYKRMRDLNAGNDALARFLREARIQARLDHPAIVPVYEMGKDSEGRPFFTMKRLAGKTLADGGNAHLIQQPARWWLPRIMERFDLARFTVMPHGFWTIVQKTA